MVDTALQRLVSPKTDVFRSLYIRRRLDNSSGDYETSWFDITDRVKKWGHLTWTIDETKLNYFQPGGISVKCQNNDGAFDDERNGVSLWYGYLTRYKTLVRIDAGFLEPTTTSIAIPPDTTTAAINSSSVQFIGVLTEPIISSDENEVALSCKSMASILEEIPANLLIIASAGGAGTGQLTASNLMTRMRDVTDGSSNFIAQKFITTGAWSITSHLQTLTTLNTSTQLDGMNCWDLAKKLAETTNYAVWITRIGGLNFNPKTEGGTTVFEFYGIPFNNGTYGHTIKRIMALGEDLDNLYNRIRIKFGETDTSTSYIIKASAWIVGDSTTSWKYGVRTLEFNNSWMAQTTADNVASTLLSDHNSIKRKLEIECKFIPMLNILDKTIIRYDPKGEGIPRWDVALWNQAVWPREPGPIYNVHPRDWKVIGLSHKMDEFETNIILKEIT